MARTLAVLTAGIVALLAPGFARAYGWPVKPFDEQHPIRGAFDDPRSFRSFHFGVDISAADGTPVYAVAPGTVYRYADAVAVRQEDGHEFAYWHIETSVPEHSFVRTGELIGYVKAPWEHVHLAEWNGTTYVNPLRPGGLEPFSDETTPVIASIDVDAANGHLEATVDAYDPAPLAPPPPWQDARWTPEIIRWRLVRDDVALANWRTVVDFSIWLKPREFDDVYAPGTEQNAPGKPGRYVFWLFRGLTLGAGQYELQVVAWDTRGNTATSSKSFDVVQVGYADARPRMHIR
ncbi:MAG TPA: M23 family metallopeptidase [Gaiellaceae bacterium]|nr:M23 family metallopeptidase [Gaiellaceae bacterium]